MKKLLLTTAILTLSNFTICGQANAIDVTSFTDVDYQQVYKSIKITVNANRMHNGDFMSIASTMNATDLYSGYGSAKMGSVRIIRY